MVVVQALPGALGECHSEPLRTADSWPALAHNCPPERQPSPSAAPSRNGQSDGRSRNGQSDPCTRLHGRQAARATPAIGASSAVRKAKAQLVAHSSCPTAAF
jgi:hypothetical protein